MQFLTRMLVVLGVLAGLGYGSYAFGKYVLSARLFGPQSSNAVSTASTGALETPKVEVVPAPTASNNSDDDSAQSVAPTRAPRPNATPDERVEIIPSDSDSDENQANNSDDNDTPRPRPTRRPRRRRRARPTPRPTQRQSTTTQSPIAAPPARDLNDDPPANSDTNSNNDAPRVEIPTPRDNNPSPAPTRRRERRTVPDAETPRAETPRREARPIPTRRRESSPVPVPEGASGGGSSSPVPVPG